MKITTIKNYNNSYKKIANKIEKSKFLQKTLYFADKNPALFQSIFVVSLASGIRPVTILSMPAKSKEAKKDNIYSASRSIITGAMDIITSFLIFTPFNKILDKTGRKLYNTKNSIYHENKEGCSAFKSITNRGLKILLLPMIAYFNFAYVKEISNGLIKLLKLDGGKNGNK